jgi:hypothetical protein
MDDDREFQPSNDIYSPRHPEGEGEGVDDLKAHPSQDNNDAGISS